MRTTKIGSDKSCDVWLDEKTVSLVHAEFIITDDKQLFLNDCASKHGTFVYRAGQWEPLRQDFIDVDEWLRFGDAKLRGGDILLHLRSGDRNKSVAYASHKDSDAPVISGPVRRNEFGEPISRE